VNPSSHTVNFSEAARLAGCSRQHLYKLAESGKLSVRQELIAGRTGDKKGDYRQLIDVAELARVLGPLSIDEKNPGLPNVGLLQAELETVRLMLADREQQLKEAKSREDWLKRLLEDMSATVKLISYSGSEQKKREDVVPKESYTKTVANAKKIIKGLRSQLEAERNRGFFDRLFGR